MFGQNLIWITIPLKKKNYLCYLRTTFIFSKKTFESLIKFLKK